MFLHTAGSFPVVAVVPAAGLGSRLGASVPKAFAELGGKTILERTLERLSANAAIDRVVVLVPSAYPDSNEYTAVVAKELTVLTGGASRQESVSIALNHLHSELPEEKTLILVHDAARCFVSNDIIERCLGAGAAFGAATAAVPMRDSLILCSNQEGEIVVDRAVAREKMWCVQTPQVFHFELLYQAHQLGRVGATDDASLVQELQPVYVVEGDALNFKITSREDLAFAEKFCV